MPPFTKTIQSAAAGSGASRERVSHASIRERIAPSSIRGLSRGGLSYVLVLRPRLTVRALAALALAMATGVKNYRAVLLLPLLALGRAAEIGRASCRERA